ncbi:MAG TPA: fatty acid desaturase [Stellaceae bacterium]|nr:fatty acid desaturase [Stellaceae bacterium]
MLVVYASGFFYFRPGWALGQVAAGVVCACALFRAGMFIHEIQHMGRGEMVPFIVAWNLVYGIPMLLPSFMYANHRDHHDWRSYGTERDAEYSDFVTGSKWQLVGHFLVAFIAPIGVTLRFLILAPISLLWPRLRCWVLRYATTLGNVGVSRRVWPDENHAAWAVLELAAFVTTLVYIVLLATGVIPWPVLTKVYAVYVAVIELNAMRDFTAHRFEHLGARSHAEQLTDSINIVGGGLGSYVLYPIGMRYHALHHLFPKMPYHSMARAHRLLMEQLPAGSPYRATNRNGFPEAASDLLRRMNAHTRER